MIVHVYTCYSGDGGDGCAPCDGGDCDGDVCDGAWGGVYRAGYYGYDGDGGLVVEDLST